MTFLDSGAGDIAASTDTPPAEQPHQKLVEWANADNIAAHLPEETLNEIGQKVYREYKIDFDSRSEWETRSKDAMDLAMQVAKEKVYPWPKAANVIFPLMTDAAIQFAARAYPAIVVGRNVVKGVVIGPDNGQPLLNPVTNQPVMNPNGTPVWIREPGAKQVRADRIGSHMSWQLLDEMKEWEPDTDFLLHALPIIGCMFRKTYFDPTHGRNMSLVVSSFDVVINYKAKSMETAPRITEEVRLYPLEVKEMERAGLFLEIAYTSAPAQDGDDDAPRNFLEQHRWWDLDEDGFPEPYIMTVHKETSQVVRIRARYDLDGIHLNAQTNEIVRIEPIHYYTKYDFLPAPDGGIYGSGFGQLLKPINEAVNSTVNQILDAGHLANTGGGFIGRGLSMNTGAVRFMPGEWKMVNVPGGTIRDNMVPIPFPGPSMVLFQMLGLLIEAGRDIASIKDILTGEQQQHNVPATTTMALIEQGLKTFTAIYKRVHRSLKEELNKLYRLNRMYLPEMANYAVGDEWKSISRQDYLPGSGVEPVSDPSMVADMQRLGQAQFLLQFANDPMFNGMAIRRRVLEAANIERIDDLLQTPPPNPAIVAKMTELSIKAQREKAAELKDLANAILFFAQADAAVGDQHLMWIQTQLDAWKAQFEASQPSGGGAEGGPSGPTAPPPAGPAPTPSLAHLGASPGVGPSL